MGRSLQATSALGLVNQLEYTHLGGIGPLYTPPDAIATGGLESGTYLGRFQFNRERISVTCRFWHRVGVDDEDDAIGSGSISVDLRDLRDEADPQTLVLQTEADNPEHESRLTCLHGSNVDDSDVVARQWRITVRRDYSGRGRISGVSWTLTATVGSSAPAECTATAGDSPCIKTFATGVYDYIATSRTDTENMQRVVGLPAGLDGDANECMLRRRTSGSSTIYQHTCEDSATDVSSTLTFNYSYNSAGGFLQPTPDT